MKANAANMRISLKNYPGVTLIEMLTVISIIGVLATIGNASYEEVRRLGRDVRRTSDIKQMQTALELYFASHNFYPSDQNPGEGGIIIGGSGAIALDDASGFTRSPQGVIYSRFSLGNPGPRGIPYEYRSLDTNGNDCDKNCPYYEIRFATEGRMAGLDEGLHILTPLGILGPKGPSELSRPETGAIVKEGAILVGVETYKAAIGLVREARIVLDNPQVEAASSVASPASAAIPLASAALSGGLALQQYLLAFITQPLLLLFRRKRKNWGVVYNALTKLPVDLAIVRLYDLNKNKIVGSTVSDRDGRFSFISPPGSYRIETVKPTLSFPSSILSGARADGGYGDLYFGETLEVSAEEPPHPNVPMDPREKDFSAGAVRARNIMAGFQHFFALIGPGIAAAAFASVPSVFSGAVLFLHILLYLFFRRLREVGRARSYGAVYEEETRRPISGAILRLYALPYHKLAETKISDFNGRYFFLVGPGEFYLTAERGGYMKTETEPVKIETRTATINAMLPLRREM